MSSCGLVICIDSAAKSHTVTCVLSVWNPFPVTVTTTPPPNPTVCVEAQFTLRLYLKVAELVTASPVYNVIYHIGFSDYNSHVYEFNHIVYKISHVYPYKILNELDTYLDHLLS